ncbi:hypothetical protein FKP32DRAFT_1649987 [Trametes sanguinea]|nr:hypothetical protein FKP32DRAFT_1649987 [Trametes sanguinea]
MGSSGTELRNDDSQTSQLLAAALRPREPQITLARSPLRDDPQVSDGSHPSSVGNSIHYHMNGLMPTQTQPLYSQDPLYEEGSQKENAPTPLNVRAESPRGSLRNVSPAGAQSAGSYPSPPEDPNGSSKESREKPCPKELGATRIVPLAKGNKAVELFSSPRAVPGIQTDPKTPATRLINSMPPPRRPRSPSPASQDSFAGPLPAQDLVKAYIETAKVFQIPLSQLGEDSQSVSEENGPPPVSSNMRASDVHELGRSSSPPGRVLVEGTPSNSSRSNDTQSQSQVQGLQSQRDESQQSFDDTQMSDLFPPGQGQSIEAELADLTAAPSVGTDDDDDEEQENVLSHSQQSYASTEPSSSYERLANQDPFASVPEATQPAHPTPEETQAVDYTAPSREMGSPSIVRDHGRNDNGQFVSPSVPSASRSNDTTRSTIPRGLLGLVAPHKRYRYQDILGGTNATAGPSTARATTHATANTTAGYDELAETQPPDVSLSLASAGGETQPSDVSAAPNDSIVPSFPRRTLPTATRVLQSLRARHESPKGVVPDSEETRMVPDSDPPLPPPSSPPANASTAPSSPVKPTSRRALQSEDEVLRAVMESAPRSVEPIAEEEEDDEEDVPLATTVQSAKAKGKQKALDPPAPAAMTSPTSPSKKNRPAPLARDKTAQSDSWKHAVVPSSDPREQIEEVTPQPKSTKPKTPVEQIAPPLTKSRSAPRQAKLAARSRLYESSDEEEDVVIPDQEDDGEDTQPAEDDMDVDPPEVIAKPVRGAKRKRTVSSSTRKSSYKGNGTRTPKQEVSTPATRPTKRLKSASNARSAGGASTRVFALWKQDGHYYSGTVHSQVELGRYDIHFDDGDSAIVELQHMRACLLRKGDNVLIHGNAKAVVIKPPTSGAAGHQAEDEVLLDLDEDGEEPFQVQNIRLAPRTVSFEWTDRMLSEDTILPVIRPKLSRASPTPSRLSAPSEGSVRAGRKPLNKTGLVITLSPNYGGKDREALTSEIRRNGGVVLDEWTTLFAMDGTITQKGQRWCLTANDIKWKNRNDVDRAFLISDEHIQKPKYLIALALGIPCVSVDWVREVVNKQMDIDWQPYLLPAGFSNHLHTRVSQLIDVDWGNSKHHLTDIATSQVPSKVFSGKSIICVSPDFVPGRQRGKKNDNSSIDSVPRIILCMGADTVEAVTDEKYASHDIREYDYIVLREKQAFERLKGYEHCVDVPWVKDCLISGRLLQISSKP